MPVYAENITYEQSMWLQRYEDDTGFEAMYQDQLDNGEITFEQLARDNLVWFMDYANEVRVGLEDALGQLELPYVDDFEYKED